MSQSQHETFSVIKQRLIYFIKDINYFYLTSVRTDENVYKTKQNVTRKFFMFKWFSQAEIFQFILFLNSKTSGPVFSTCRAQFCCPQAFVLLVGT